MGADREVSAEGESCGDNPSWLRRTATWSSRSTDEEASHLLGHGAGTTTTTTASPSVSPRRSLLADPRVRPRRLRPPPQIPSTTARDGGISAKLLQALVPVLCYCYRHIAKLRSFK
jgi:hypothetical protein